MNIMKVSVYPLRAAPGFFASVLMISLIFQGCGSETTSGPGGSASGPEGSLVFTTGCKDPQMLSPGAAPANLDCISWEYDGSGKLSLMHVNAGLNCCPGTIRAEIVIEGDSITITENEGEDSEPCRCLCLYDLGYEITGIEDGTYTLRFVEEYLQPGDGALEVTVDLAAEPEGSLCLPRSSYPWGAEYMAGDPAGLVASSTGCAAGDEFPYPGDRACISFTYDLEGHYLWMFHYNAGLNCCVDTIAGDYTFGPDLVVIEEIEVPEGMCDCICLHGVEHEIFNLEPGVYTFRFVEPYLPPGQEPLEFTIDVAEYDGRLGLRCVDRTGYPWGISDEEADKRTLRELYDAIVDYIGTPYCQWERDCRTIGVGSKPCGGPWEYLVYSASTLDEEVLSGLVGIHADFEDYMNRKYGYVSTCDVPPVPETRCIDGICTAVFPASTE